jgi:AcrR family transcriptional regulator
MNVATPRRAYRQSARAAAAEATGHRILNSFARQMREHWFDEIRLDDVARESGVTVQTVIRRFGGKEGLLDAMHRRLNLEIHARREVPPGDAVGAVESLIEDYEQIGDLIIRTLAQEDRYPAVRAMTDAGRAFHREWMGRAFAPWLAQIVPDLRRRAHDALVVAGDLYVWKLLRRDMGRPIAEYRALVETMCASALARPVGELFRNRQSGDVR